MTNAFCAEDAARLSITSRRRACEKERRRPSAKQGSVNHFSIGCGVVHRVKAGQDIECSRDGSHRLRFPETARAPRDSHAFGSGES